MNKRAAAGVESTDTSPMAVIVEESVSTTDASPMAVVVDNDVPATDGANRCAPLSTSCCNVTSPDVQRAGGA